MMNTRLTRMLLSALLSLSGTAPSLAQTANPSQPAPAQAPVAIPGARPAPGAAAAARPTAATPAAAPAAAPSAPPAPAPATAAKPPAPAAAATPQAAEADRTPARNRQDLPTPPPAAAVAEPPSKPAPLKPLSCSVAEFRAIGIDTTDERTRRNRAAGWLQRKAKDCTPEQLIVIRNNRSQWLGNADSAELAAAVDALLESFAQTNPDVALLLYGTPPVPAPPPGDGTNTTPPRR